MTLPWPFKRRDASETDEAPAGNGHEPALTDQSRDDQQPTLASTDTDPAVVTSTAASQAGAAASQAGAAASQAMAFADLGALEAEMVTFLSARIDTLGIDGSGLGAYYAQRVMQGRVFGDADTMLLDVVPYNFLEFDTVVEAGAGFGQLGLGLGLLGRRVVLIEADRKRFECMAALKGALEQEHPAIAQNVSLLHGTWPGVLDGEDISRALLVAVDFVYTGVGDIEAEAIDALKRYGGAIIDASHFVHTRLTSEKRFEFYDAIAASGLPVPSKLPPHRNDRQSEFLYVSRDLI